MSGDLVYRTKNQDVFSWIHSFGIDHVACAEAWNDFQVLIGMRYPAVSGRVRSLQVKLGLVGGFQIDWQGEPPPEGWVIDPAWQGFVPDVETEMGREWQKAIDQLPQMQPLSDAGEHGMVSHLVFQIEGQPDQVMFPTFFHDDKTGTVYTMWPSREVAPIIEKILGEIVSDVTWEPMLRSDWYLWVESQETVPSAPAADD
jgi:hypothetical protein